MEPAPTFGPRLRQERERRQISLTSIAENTKISRSLLEALERDDVSRWPGGIFRRSFVRAYAEAIGLDPDEIVREFNERFADPSHPRADLQGAAPDAAHTSAAGKPAAAAKATILAKPSGDRVEIVLRFSVPRTLVAWLTWLTSLASMPRRQNT